MADNEMGMQKTFCRQKKSENRTSLNARWVFALINSSFQLLWQLVPHTITLEKWHGRQSN